MVKKSMLKRFALLLFAGIFILAVYFYSYLQNLIHPVQVKQKPTENKKAQTKPKTIVCQDSTAAIPNDVDECLYIGCSGLY